MPIPTNTVVSASPSSVTAAAVLVLLMPGGLSLLAAGLSRAKNASHTIFLALFGTALALAAFWLLGSRCSGNVPDNNTLFLFRAATTAIVVCIPIGALAERWSLKHFYLSALAIAGVLWPVAALWSWNGGWLAKLGYLDPSGSGVIHLFGGAVALAGALVIGPRLGRYNKDGRPLPIPAHNVPLALTGSMLLSVGWLALNADAATTALAGAGGTIAAVTFMTLRNGKPDPTLAVTGLLAGLAASGAIAGPTFGLFTGAVAGLLACVLVPWFDRVKIDDPAGSISIHGAGGLCGVLAASFASTGHFAAQVAGMAALGGGGFAAAWVLFKALDRLTPMRVAPEVEWEGLDIGETGLMSYPEFRQ